MKTRIAQCWDDGILDDIRLCEILRKYGAKASFNLNPGIHRQERFCDGNHRGREVWKLALPELKEVYEGFHIANHTFKHPHLTRIPLDEARREIIQGRDVLEQIFGYGIEGFAYPYGDYNLDIQEMVRSTGHLYARTCVNTMSVLPVKDPMDFRPSCHFRAENFWSLFEQAQISGNVFYFWGHSYEFLTESDWQAFEETLQRLSEQGEWVSLPSLFQPFRFLSGSS